MTDADGLPEDGTKSNVLEKVQKGKKRHTFNCVT